MSKSGMYSVMRVPAHTVLLMLSALSCADRDSTAVQSARNGEAEPVTVVRLCAVVEDPARYDGKRVSMIGCVTTDGREYVVLSDLGYPCARGGIVPIDAPTLRREQQFDAHPGKKVCGTFVGTFRASNGLYERVLEVEETSNLATSALVE